MEPATIELPSGKVECRDVGTGPAILFLHGLGLAPAPDDVRFGRS